MLRLMPPSTVSLTFCIALAAACAPNGPDRPDASGPPLPDAGDPVARLARGKYLVEDVLTCAACHTPRNGLGGMNEGLALSGVDCSIPSLEYGVPSVYQPDAALNPDGGSPVLCAASRNLTNDETGLKNFTDAQIIAMFRDGVRPNGDRLSPVMPYEAFHMISDDDALAIVAYLRTVPPVNHRSARDPAYFDPPTQPVPPRLLQLEETPAPNPSSGNYDSAVRGRYLAAIACMPCHTPYMNIAPADYVFNHSLLYGGNQQYDFTLDVSVPQSGLPPAPPFPPKVTSTNLTPDPTGLVGYTTADLVKLIKTGVAKDGSITCPPMGGLADILDSDATDIANYLLSIPPLHNPTPPLVICNFL